MGAVVVQNQVDVFPTRRGAFDLLQETDELCVPVARHALTNHRAIKRVERRKQAGGTMADIVVGLPSRKARAQGQYRLRAI
jgi:hypothetical protein